MKNPMIIFSFLPCIVQLCLHAIHIIDKHKDLRNNLVKLRWNHIPDLQLRKRCRKLIILIGRNLVLLRGLYDFLCNLAFAGRKDLRGCISRIIRNGLKSSITYALISNE